MQFEVAEHRMAGEFSAPVRLDRLEYTMARLTDAEWAKVLDRESGVEVLERSSDGAAAGAVRRHWRLARVQRDHPDVVLDPSSPRPTDRLAGDARAGSRVRPLAGARRLA
jgi:peptide chain release factor 3